MASISVNKLAEFLVTPNPARRRRIVHDQKYPSTAIVAKYRNAYPPIAEYLRNGRRDATILDAVSRLRADREGTDWVLDDRWNTADALERFLEIADVAPHADGEIYQAGASEAPKLNIAGVDISVRPDFLISFSKRGKKQTGALKFHFIKNADNALTKAGTEYVATLMYQWLLVNGPDGTTPSHAHCLCIDVFRGAVTSAPKSTSRRMTEVVAACEEIEARWPNL